MPHPCDFRDDGSVYPTFDELRAERLARRAARLGRALGDIDAALEELNYRCGRLPTDAAAATDDELADMEAVAAALKAAALVAEARA